MKYEMIFGDEALFDGAPESATHAVKGGGFYSVKNKFVSYVSSGIFNGSNVEALGGYLIAERRIIKEPKRWTWEDKKAGRLPEVGWLVYSENDSKSALVIAKDHEGDIWFQCSCGVVRCTDGYVMLPIETPAEKAKRLRDEWCSECTFKYYPRGHKGFPEMIYDALLSGELPMPKKGGE